MLAEPLVFGILNPFLGFGGKQIDLKDYC